MPETGHKGLLMPGFRFNTNTILHIFGKGELPAQSAEPKSVDLSTLIAPFRPDLTSFNETTLNGMVGKEQEGSLC